METSGLIWKQTAANVPWLILPLENELNITFSTFYAVFRVWLMIFSAHGPFNQSFTSWTSWGPASPPSQPADYFSQKENVTDLRSCTSMKGIDPPAVTRPATLGIFVSQSSLGLAGEGYGSSLALPAACSTGTKQGRGMGWMPVVLNY